MKKESKIDLKETTKVVDKQELNLWKRGFTPQAEIWNGSCLLYTSPSPRDLSTSRMPSSA